MQLHDARAPTLNNPRGIRTPNNAASPIETLAGSKSEDPNGRDALMMRAAFRKVEKANASYMLVWVSSRRSNARSDSRTRTWLCVCVCVLGGRRGGGGG